MPSPFIDFLGPLLIGVVCNAVVFGVCCMQLLTYLTAGYNDPLKLKIMIAWVYAVDIFQLWESVATLWYYTVAHYNDPAALLTGPWVYAALPIFGSLAIVPIQIFMASRIMRFAQSKLLFFVLCSMSLIQAALACTAATLGMINPAVSNHINIIPIADAWLGFSVFCDATITGLLLYYLMRSRTGFQKTDNIIMRICITTMEAAVPVSILCLGDLIALTVNPRSNWHYMFALPVGRLYTNSLMVTLNERRNLRSQMEQSIPNGISLGNVSSSKHRSVRSAHPKPPVHISIQQDIETRVEDQTKSSTFHTGDRDSDLSLGYNGHSEKGLQSPVSPITPVGVAYLDLHADRQKAALLDVERGD